MVSWGTGNDSLAFDGEGNLWVLQDGDENYIWVVEKSHTQDQPKVNLFGIAPLGSEPTGITFTPDYKYLFMSIQGPDETNESSEQIDAAGRGISFNNHISIVIAREEHLGL
jgi:secreted PhoX family phosphatase